MEICLRCDPFSSLLHQFFGVSQQLPTAHLLHQSVLDCYRGTSNPFANSPFASSERSHFFDVAHCLDILRWVTGIALCTLFTLGLIYKRSMCFFWMRLGFYYYCALLVAAACIASRWLLCFRGMHPLIFSGKTWDFHPSDLIIRLYPESFLASYAIAIVVSSLALSLALFLCCKRHSHTHESPPANRTRSTFFSWGAHTWYTLCAGVCAVIPCYLLGQHMILPWTYSWVGYWVLCLSICLACCYIVTCHMRTSRIRSPHNYTPALLALFISTCLLQSFATGVRTSSANAQRILHSHAPHYITAINNYRSTHQHLPTDRHTLHRSAPNLSTHLPAPFHRMHYIPSSNGYRLYFTGPLFFDFSCHVYHAQKPLWNSMRLP